MNYIKDVAAALLTAAGIAASCVAQAEDPVYTKRVDDWTIDVYSTAAEATTSNGSGSVFGYICTAADQQCRYYLNAGITCDDGASIPVLINSDAGAMASILTCTLLGKEYFTFLPYEAVESSSENSEEIGFAVPMQSGQFKAVRFSFVGYAKATKAAEELVKTLQAPKASPSKGRDTYL